MTCLPPGCLSLAQLPRLGSISEAPEGPVLPPLHPSSRAHPLAGSPEARPRTPAGESKGEASRRAQECPSHHGTDGHRNRYGAENAGAPAHRISLGKKGAVAGPGVKRGRRSRTGRWEGWGREGWKRSLEKRFGSAWVTSEARSVCLQSVQLDPRPPGGERLRRRRLQGRQPHSPSPPRSPLAQAAAGPGLRRGMGMRWCGRVSGTRASALHPGVVVPVGDRGREGGRGRGGTEGMGRTAGRAGRPSGLESSAPQGPS